MTVSAKQKIGFGAAMLGVFYLLSDVLLDLFFEFLHLCFEAVEFTVDVIIEHLFGTDRHATQVVTFYILLLFAAYVLYKMSRKLPAWYGTLKTELADIHHHITEAAVNYWNTASTVNLMIGWSVFMVSVSIMLMWSLLA
ncbi:hypothetical protein [Methylomicrobium sp. Wu6]|uniref:hypothetical protein n=1 Tax=Methylomicrobium sp. Wu6 TaxID=3107928 RepID=UPI002DD65BF1|nr:hypothetical protein [Methylomicrobium sp. Wu6]MEC4748377.1 hypothetical protein [Methylomicrobium sp. Wu6]